MIEQSRRLASVQAPIMSIVSRWVAETPGTISLGQGVVSYGPPAEAIEALKRFPESPKDHLYGPGEGLPELVDAIERKLLAENGMAVQPHSRVFVTAGGNFAFMNALLAITDPGDEIILPLPLYFNHEMAVGIAGCRAISVATDADWQPDLEAMAWAITPRTRAIVTISPNNPTGAVYSESALRQVNALCRERGLFHIHDEVYEYFTYDGARHFSPGSIEGAAAHTISLYSLSKAYGFASWRIGYMVFPAILAEAVDKIQDTVLICPPVVSQHVALAALRVGRDYCRPHLDRLADVRRTVLETLSDPRVPCRVPPAAGAFYYFIQVETPLDGMTMAERLIREHRVAVIPGAAFGVSDGCFLRVAYGALEPERAKEGIARLAEGLIALGRR